MMSVGDVLECSRGRILIRGFINDNYLCYVYKPWDEQIRIVHKNHLNVINNIGNINDVEQETPMLRMMKKQLKTAKVRVSEAIQKLNTLNFDEMDEFNAREELRGALASVKQFETMISTTKHKNKVIVHKKKKITSRQIILKPRKMLFKL